MIKGLNISGWQKTSFIDFPAAISSVLFLSGCNLRCPYCHNPGIVLGLFEPIPIEEILKHLVKRKGIIEGVVISGGEPTLHLGLKNLCEELRGLGVRVKIDTNGLEPEAIAECAPDYLALDIKTSLGKYSRLKTAYADCTDRLRRSIDIAKAMGKDAEVRITAVPGVVAGDDIDDLCIEQSGIDKVFIQQFDPSKPMLDPTYSSVTPYTPQELESWRAKFLDAGIECRIR